MEPIKRTLSHSQPSPQRTSRPPIVSTDGAGDPDCPKCHGVGYRSHFYPPGHPEFGKCEPCVCRTAQVVKALQKVSGLTEVEQKLRLTDIDAQSRPQTAAMVAACRDFVANPTGMLTIWGPCGVAKTMALQAVTNELVLAKVEAVYITAFDLIAYVQAAFDEPQVQRRLGAAARLKRFGTVRVLMLDEFDKRTDTDWAQKQITNLIDRRYRLGGSGELGTLIGTNTDPRLEPQWIASRLLDGRNRVVHNGEADLRPAMK